MRTIYIDAENNCHVADDGTMTAVETAFFDGKCDAFVEGFCYEVEDKLTRIYPRKPYAELDAVQREYERELLTEYEAELSELRENSVPIAELEAAYEEGVNSV